MTIPLVSNPTRAIFCNCTSDTGEFDPGVFVESVILFDEVILSNPSKIAEIIRATGIDGFRLLLESGNVCILGGGAIAQALYDFKSPGLFQNKREIFRPLNYGFETIFVDTKLPSNRSSERILRAEVGKTKRIARVKNRDLDRIFHAICETKREIDPHSLRQLEEFQRDVESKHDYLVKILIQSLKAQTGLSLGGLKWSLAVKPIDQGIFRVDTDLGSLLDIRDTDLHNIFKTPFYDASGTYLQLERMRVVNAAAGLSDVQARIVSQRLDFMSAIYSTSDRRAEISKIIEISGAPRLQSGESFDAENLLALRNSDDARAFRDWIHGATALDEQQLEELIGGWKNTVGESLKTSRSGVVKWLASSGIGALTFPGAGGAVTLIDKYLKKTFPGRGPIGFIGNGYAEYIEDQRKN